MADNTTHDNLQKAIDQTDGVKDGKAKDDQDAASALQSAFDQVNASMQAKSQTDQQSAAAQQSAPSHSGGGHTPSHRPPPTKVVGGWPTPAPAAPQGGGSDGFVWNQWKQNHKPIGNHGCNSDGSCGVD
ncbi:hypothetical protein [Bifidobacterium indicum]|uniref:hypothetical protein n=1 Tax=Bifidobacterium indicum TaxID=1691 RepID=UPI0030D903E8